MVCVNRWVWEEFQIGEHLAIGGGRAALGGQVVADHGAAGTGEKHPALEVAEAVFAATGDPDVFVGQDEPEHSDGLQSSHRSNEWAIGKSRAGNRLEEIQGYRNFP